MKWVPVRIALAVLVVAAVLAGVHFYNLLTLQMVPPSAPPTVQLGGQTIQVTMAVTPEALQRGLSGFESLGPDEGMLFVFPEDGKYAFWMKDMRFSIDILWLSESGTIVHMVQSVSPDTYPQNFAPPVPARYVLELPAGFVGRNSISVGDIVRL